MGGIMKKLLLCLSLALCAHFACAQSQPIVEVDNISITHEPKGWRVVNASTTPIHFNLMKGDLIVRIDGKNASETGPMQMASLLNEGYRRAVRLFIERGVLRSEINLREIPTQDYSPVGANPFRHVASGFNAPDFELKDIDGKPVTLEQFRDKWLLIDFMATWCPPCQETLPQLLSVVNRTQVSLLMVALNDKAESVQRLRQSYRIDAPIAMTQITSQLPIDFGIATNRWEAQVPGWVLLRPNGEVALIKIGLNKPDRLERAIQSLMNSKTEEVSK